jgi:tRNA pseudouridine38-40 synthase
VHASGQVLKIILPKEIIPDQLVMGMNSKLPPDIRVVSAEFVDKKFNVNRDTKSKEYHYYFTDNKSPNAILSEIICYIPRTLNIELIEKACELLLGEHDFANFCAESSREMNTIRNITYCSIEKASFAPFSSEVYFLNIQAAGFLKYMVRYIMGALIEVGQEKLSFKDFKNSLTPGTHSHFKKKAPAVGLHLIKINY